MMPESKKKSPCKKSTKRQLAEEKERAVAFTGITPLAFLLKVMREREPEQERGEDPADYRSRLYRHEDRALEAAKFAAPYVHPKLQSVEHKGDAEHPVNMNLTVKFV